MNYDSFLADDDVADAYMDAVRYVQETYYLKVTRYTTNAFTRLKMSRELAKRNIESPVKQSIREGA